MQNAKCKIILESIVKLVNLRSLGICATKFIKLSNLIKYPTFPPVGYRFRYLCGCVVHSSCSVGIVFDTYVGEWGAVTILFRQSPTSKNKPSAEKTLRRVKLMAKS